MKMFKKILVILVIIESTFAIDYLINKCLNPRQKRESKNGCFTAIYQEDGNFVIYKKPGIAIWSTGTWTPGNCAGRACMQKNGDFVIFDCRDSVRFRTNTVSSVSEDAVMRIMNDGNLKIFAENTNYFVLWSSNSTSSC